MRYIVNQSGDAYLQETSLPQHTHILWDRIWCPHKLKVTVFWLLIQLVVGPCRCFRRFDYRIAIRVVHVLYLDLLVPIRCCRCNCCQCHRYSSSFFCHKGIIFNIPKMQLGQWKLCATVLFQLPTLNIGVYIMLCRIRPTTASHHCLIK